MLRVPHEVQQSPIHGRGVFVLRNVRKGETIWEFGSCDQQVHPEELSLLPEEDREEQLRFLYWEEKFGCYVYCGDGAIFTNHSENPTGRLSQDGSSIIAIRNLKAGEELTEDYRTYGFGPYPQFSFLQMQDVEAQAS